MKYKIKNAKLIKKYIYILIQKNFLINKRKD